jgi:hypothetical protein
VHLDLSEYIARPPVEVFRFCAVDHVRNHPRWDPDMQLEQLSEGPIGVGTVIRRSHTHYDEPAEETMEVVEFEPNRAMSVVIHDEPIEIHGRTSMEPEGEGGTRLTMSIEIPGSTNPIDPALIERTLHNIKTLIETEIPTAT